MVGDLLNEATVVKRGLFDPVTVKQIIALNESGREDLNLQVFQLLTLEIWMQQFLDR
jgi:hypothetical protein